MPPLPSKPIELPPLGCENTVPEPAFKIRFDALFDGPKEPAQDPDPAWPHLYEDCQAIRIAEWRETVRAFEADPDQFLRAWHFLNGHPMFWTFYGQKHPLAQRLQEQYLEHEMGISECVDVTVYERDGRTWIMLEAGKHEWPRENPDPHGEPAFRDRRLTSRAATMEAAYIALAGKVHEHYGNDRRLCGDPAPEAADA